LLENGRAKEGGNGQSSCLVCCYYRYHITRRLLTLAEVDSITENDPESISSSRVVCWNLLDAENLADGIIRSNSFRRLCSLDCEAAAWVKEMKKVHISLNAFPVARIPASFKSDFLQVTHA
jgi:hypothetical protein